MDELKARQELYNGFGDTMARGFEIAITPVLVAGIGFLIDHFAGTLPVFTIAFALFGLAGVGVRSYYQYDARMRLHEAEGPWAPRAPADPQAAPYGVEVRPAPAAAPVVPANYVADAYIAQARASAEGRQ